MGFASQRAMELCVWKICLLLFTTTNIGEGHDFTLHLVSTMSFEMDLALLITFLYTVVNGLILHIPIITQLSLKLIKSLCRGTQTWVIMLGRLILFSIFLLPGWFGMLRYWLFSPNILRWVLIFIYLLFALNEICCHVHGSVFKIIFFILLLWIMIFLYLIASQLL